MAAVSKSRMARPVSSHRSQAMGRKVSKRSGRDTSYDRNDFSSGAPYSGVSAGVDPDFDDFGGGGGGGLGRGGFSLYDF